MSSEVDVSFGTARVQLDPATEFEMGPHGGTRVIWNPEDVIKAAVMALGAVGARLTPEARDHLEALDDLHRAGRLRT